MKRKVKWFFQDYWIAILVCVVALGGGFWAGRTTVAPAGDYTDIDSSELVMTVTEQSVGRTITLGVGVSQPTQPLAVNMLSGIVTGTRSTGEVKVGEVLYAVAGQPVVAVLGSLPFYRPLARGVKGPDVQQLRDALVTLGYASSAGNEFTAGTETAVKAWQKALGIDQSGVINLGVVVAVPHLPGNVVIDDQVLTLGAMFSGGEQVVSGASGDPEFILSLSTQQAQMISTSAKVTIEHEGKSWDAVVAKVTTDENNLPQYVLSAPDGGTVCGTDCGAFATGTQISVLAKVSVGTPATGPGVPIAAITTSPDGTASVTVVATDGTRSQRTVTVLGSSDGMAVVDGLEIGEQVQVLADKADNTPVVPPSATGSPIASAPEATNGTEPATTTDPSTQPSA